jgi:hypothetical protein
LAQEDLFSGGTDDDLCWLCHLGDSEMGIKPYYEEPGITIYHGDCREILPHLEPVDLVLTSPPYDDLRFYGGQKFYFKETAIKI